MVNTRDAYLGHVFPQGLRGLPARVLFFSHKIINNHK